MAQCYDNLSNQYFYCTSHTAAYIAVVIIIPLVILIITVIVSVYLRYRQRRLRRDQQQINMTTVVPIHNNDEQQQTPYNYSYPPTYTAINDIFDDKPPSYEQTITQLSETNHTTGNEAAILPVTTVTSSLAEPAQPLRNQT